MRKTLFILTRSLIPIVYNATKYLWKKYIQKSLDHLEISREEYNIIVRKILNLLKNKELTTKEIKIALNTQVRISEIIKIMCDKCLLIRGHPIKSWKDRRLYYARFQDYFPKLNLNIYNEQDSTITLIEKYIDAYGPVTLEDIAWWSGIGKNKINPAIFKLENKIERIKISQLSYEFLISKKVTDKLELINQNKVSTINFLPLLDPYMMSYKNRERYISSKYYNYVYNRAGNATSTIMLNGKVIGVWDFTEKPDCFLKYYLFEDIFPNLLTLIHKQGERIGKFLIGSKVKLKKCIFMEKLTDRNAGGFMAPLKNC